MTVFSSRMQTFRGRLAEAGIDVALITDDDNVYYLTGYYDYLHMEFGRPDDPGRAARWRQPAHNTNNRPEFRTDFGAG